MLSGVSLSTVLTRNVFFVLAMVSIANTSFAQKEREKNKTVYFSIGPELAVPVGDISPSSNFAVGGSALLEVKASQPVGITLGLCYIHYFPKNKPVYSGVATDQLAALLGVRYYFDTHFFASGQAGLSLHQDEYREIGLAGIIVPGIGVKYGLLDATLKYMTTNRDYSSLSNISLRIAVAF